MPEQGERLAEEQWGNERTAFSSSWECCRCWTSLSQPQGPGHPRDDWELLMLESSTSHSDLHGCGDSGHGSVCCEWHPVFTQIPYSWGTHFPPVLSFLSFCLPRWQSSRLEALHNISLNHTVYSVKKGLTWQALSVLSKSSAQQCILESLCHQSATLH